MGAVYQVNLRFRPKDEQSIVKALQNKIQRDTEAKTTRYNLEKFAAKGIGTDTLEDSLAIFLADFHKGRMRRYDNGMIEYENGFDANYGWERVLDEMIKEIAPFLENGSEMYIYPDEDYDYYIVENGKALQLH